MAYKKVIEVERTIACSADGQVFDRVTFLSATSIKMGDDTYKVDDLRAMLDDHKTTYTPQVATREDNSFGR